MSAFDELYEAAMAEKRKDPLFGGRFSRGGLDTTLGTVEDFDLRGIANALERARASEGQPLPEHYALPDYPGQTAPLRMAGVEVGSHGLTLIEGVTCYQSVTGVDGVTPALQLRARRWFTSESTDEIFLAFGDLQTTGVRGFDRAFGIRAASRGAAVALLTPALVEQLVRVGSDLVSVTLRPEQGRTYCEVRVEVQGATKAEPAIALARAAHAATEKLVRTPGGFVSTAEAHALTMEEIRALVSKVRDTVSFLAGHVERVGDGVEARLELDEPAGMHAILRLEPVGPRALRATFRGDLRPTDTTRETRLSPELGFLQKLRGLSDPKVGDPALDKAFLVVGERAMARLAVADASAALRLAGRRGTLTIDGAGFHVDVPSLPVDDAVLLEVTLAAVSCWRQAALTSAGFVEAAIEG